MNKLIVALTVVVLAAGIWVLRAKTMTVHTPVDPESSLLVRFRADTRGPGDPIDRLARAHFDLCVAESVPGSRMASLTELPTDDMTPPLSAPEDGASRHAYEAIIRPGADDPDRDQLHGCLEDLRVRHLRLEVHRMELRLDGRVLETRGT